MADWAFTAGGASGRSWPSYSGGGVSDWRVEKMAIAPLPHTPSSAGDRSSWLSAAVVAFQTKPGPSILVIRSTKHSAARQARLRAARLPGATRVLAEWKSENHRSLQRNIWLQYNWQWMRLREENSSLTTLTISSARPLPPLALWCLLRQSEGSSCARHASAPSRGQTASRYSSAICIKA